MSDVDNAIAIIKGEIDLIVTQLVSLESYLSEDLLSNSGTAITKLKTEVTNVRTKMNDLSLQVDDAASVLRNNYV